MFRAFGLSFERFCGFLVTVAIARTTARSRVGTARMSFGRNGDHPSSHILHGEA